MRNLNAKAFIWSLLLLSLLIWAGILFLAGFQFKDSWKALRVIPTVVMIDAVLWGLFVKWGWKFRLLQGWLIPFPVLEGSWQGTFQTTWKDPQSGEPPGPIQAYLVIKQSFLSISCVMYTGEMISRSYSADFRIDREGGFKQLVYSYTSTPRVTVRDRNMVHDGTVVLDIITKPKRILKGEYWTNRKTTGEKTLTYRSSTLLEDYPD